MFDCHPPSPAATSALLFLLLTMTQMPSSVLADDYTVREGHKSMLCAVGCFWCGEQAFEQYAPGVVEAVSGYAGGTNDNPTYRNHPGHYEVVLVEYDPKLTSYELIVNYAWRNLDPFDGIGQFCDKGTSYRPAIFYANQEEKEIADRVREEVLAANNWTLDEIAVPNLERPKFWTAEGYHQDYYIKVSDFSGTIVDKIQCSVLSPLTNTFLCASFSTSYDYPRIPTTMDSIRNAVAVLAASRRCGERKNTNATTTSTQPASICPSSMKRASR